MEKPDRRSHDGGRQYAILKMELLQDEFSCIRSFLWKPIIHVYVGCTARGAILEYEGNFLDQEVLGTRVLYHSLSIGFKELCRPIWSNGSFVSSLVPCCSRFEENPSHTAKLERNCSPR